MTELSSFDVAVIIILYVPGCVTFNTFNESVDVKGALPEFGVKLMVEKSCDDDVVESVTECGFLLFSVPTETVREVEPPCVRLMVGLLSET